MKKVRLFVGDFDTWTARQAAHANKAYPGCEPTERGIMHLMRTWHLLETSDPPNKRIRGKAMEWAQRAFVSKR